MPLRRHRARLSFVIALGLAPALVTGACRSRSDDRWVPLGDESSFSVDRTRIAREADGSFDVWTRIPDLDSVRTARGDIRTGDIETLERVDCDRLRYLALGTVSHDAKGRTTLNTLGDRSPLDELVPEWHVIAPGDYVEGHYRSLCTVIRKYAP